VKPDADPFEGMPRYSWRYDEQRRAIPQLSARPFGKSPLRYQFESPESNRFKTDKSLFPEELWSTLEGEEGKAVRKTINQGMKKKADMLTGSANEKDINNFEKIKNIFEAEEADSEVEEEEDNQEEEKDYDYEEDEAEMGGDYGAEQYFDGGEGDDDDGMDAGGGDDY